MPQLSLFATPVSMYDLPDMEEVNRDLTARLVAESDSVPSTKPPMRQPSDTATPLSTPETALQAAYIQVAKRILPTSGKSSSALGSSSIKGRQA